MITKLQFTWCAVLQSLRYFDVYPENIASVDDILEVFTPVSIMII